MIITLAEAKSKLGIEGAEQDEAITVMLTDLTSEIEATTGRSFGEIKTVTDEEHDYSPRVFLDNIDINSVTSVKIGYGDDPEVDTTDIHFNGEGRVKLSSSAGHRSSTSDMDEVRVTYTHGIAEAKVPADMKNAAKQLIYQYWNATEGGTPTEKRVTSESIGTYRVTYANEGNVDQKTSINDFNTVLRKYTWKLKA